MMADSWGKLRCFTFDLRNSIQRDGWRQAGCWLAKTLIEVPYRRLEYIVYTRSLLEPLAVAKPRLPVTLRLATKADLFRFEGAVTKSEAEHFRRRLDHGRYCFLALDGENLAAYCWASTEVRCDVDKLEMRLQEGDAYVDDAFTVPAYRRQGIQTAVHLYRLEHMKNLGCRRAILIVRVTNTASQRLVSKLGYQETDRLSFRRILWKRTYHYESGKF
jgi:ribosomal protein S18 acetylase RimI-like enzyme